MDSGHLPPIVAILGPTAIGKSELGLWLAREYDGEIVSVDSRQVYRLLDIGTAKAKPSERASVRHHLIDLCLPDRTYTVADFVHDAGEVLLDIRCRKKLAILVGGTGHYARALLEGQAFPRVPPNEERRRRIEETAQRLGTPAVIESISRIDPMTAARLDPANQRRVVRALEIIEATGKPIPPVHSNPLPALVLGLRMPRAQLYQRADERVAEQMDEGLLAETEGVLAQGFSPQLPVLRGLAYGQMIAHLQGTMTLSQATEAYRYATHRLIRRQMSWLLREPRLEWEECGLPGLHQRVSGRIEPFLRNTPL